MIFLSCEVYFGFLNQIKKRLFLLQRLFGESECCGPLLTGECLSKSGYIGLGFGELAL